MAIPESSPLGAHRARWILSGRVQGVGFRPFVWQFAHRESLTGVVYNEADRVVVELQGSPSRLEAFEEHLTNRLPPLAFLASRRREEVPLDVGELDFKILDSRGGESALAFAASDAAVCPDCLAEMRSAGDRRHGYALINCTQCGPRFSILRGLPYDRPSTTMAGFPMCPECLAEYGSPESRRFHAQANACPVCGPQLEWWVGGDRLFAGDPVSCAVEALMAGGIVAIKGLGGYHLAVRARDSAAVDRLRARKRRETKPFALMVADSMVARDLVELSPDGLECLESTSAPILLARRKAGADVAPGVAPGQGRLGVMLAYTPLHHLLFDRGPGLGPLVMTSGNVSDEPLCIDDSEARKRLLEAAPGDAPLADAMLLHNRPIQRPVDDSVWADLGPGPRGGVLPLRRARGYAPAPVGDIGGGLSGLALGGDLKAAPALICEGRVVLGQHLGDLENPLAFDQFQRTVSDLMDLYRVKPRFIAIDAHPRYFGGGWGRELSRELGARLIEVQHHHAHGASVLAENGHAGPALAVVCDGTGYGEDGTTWGGELLLIDGGRFTRLARLAPLRLPGGEAASRETRRCALAILHACFGDSFHDHPMAERLYPDAGERGLACSMIRGNISCAQSSGAGRYVDGVAAFLGLASYNHHEALSGQALEASASAWSDGALETPKAKLLPGEPANLDLSPILIPLIEAALAPAGREGVARWAAYFHLGVSSAWDELVAHFSGKTGVRTVGISGGVFSNVLLTRYLSEALEKRGMVVLRHRQVPPNDGGLALGQAAVAAQRILTP